jgi:hypothetical protein
VTDFTDGLKLGLITPGGDAHLLHNLAMVKLDLLLGRGVEGAQNNAPTSPSEWDAYIVYGAPSSGDAWEDQENSIAIYWGGQWQYIAPEHGLRVWNRESNTLWLYTSSWQATGAGVSTFACGMAASTIDNTSAANTYQKVPFDNAQNVLIPADLFTHSTDGQVVCVTGGTYLIEFSIEVTASSATAVGLAVGRNSASSAVSGSEREHDVGAGLQACLGFMHILTVTAGQYLAPLFKNTDAAGTVTVTYGRGMLRITKLNP